MYFFLSLFFFLIIILFLFCRNYQHKLFSSFFAGVGGYSFAITAVYPHVFLFVDPVSSGTELDTATLLSPLIWATAFRRYYDHECLRPVETQLNESPRKAAYRRRSEQPVLPLLCQRCSLTRDSLRVITYFRSPLNPSGTPHIWINSFI